MQRLNVKTGLQCLHDLRFPLIEKRILYRSRSAAAMRKFRKNSYGAPPYDNRPPSPPVTRVQVSPTSVRSHLSSNAKAWSQKPSTEQRLIRFGIPPEVLPRLLQTFVNAMEDGIVIRDLEYTHEELSRMAFDLSDIKNFNSLDRFLNKLLYEWAAHPAGSAMLSLAVPKLTLQSMKRLYDAADLSDPPSLFPLTRASTPRKIIMHIGPTNSGKTHNALRALASARKGLYAGPLRLLAYEIWERLNKGQIVPLGVEADALAQPDEESDLDIDNGTSDKVVIKDGNPKFARACNMITGEEQKIVKEGAPLLSCTVEMTPFAPLYDVAVIDEIQLIADPERGGAWTTAVLGIKAKELHLCGEESAVPIVRALVKDLGDEVIIERYSRLTPLTVADESLRGDLSLIQKGDCVVTFSRKSIFGLKSRIEERTGLRCAVAYGRLPPEIRSEQAALFNDPNSGYDVLIGSDAIGMGLNLKIKRIVFEAVRKYDGSRERPLSFSQIKQIAGRAGRFGLHGSDSSGGIVTTLHEPDLAVLRKALVAPFNPLPYACMQVYPELFRDISYTLPLNAGSSTAMEAFTYVSKMHPSYEFEDITKLKTALEFIDRFTADLTVPDRLMIRLAPTPWRDSYAADALMEIIKRYITVLHVNLVPVLQTSELYECLEDVEAMMKSDNTDDLVPTADMLQQLESLHKIVVVYLWLSYRLTIAFPDMEDAFLLRERAENAMDWCLQGLDTLQHAPRVRAPAGVGIKYFTGKDAKMLKKQTTTVHKRAQNVSGGPMKEFDDLVIR